MSTIEWTVRRATTTDLAAIMELETTTFATDAWNANTMKAELANPHSYYLVAAATESATASASGPATAPASTPDPAPAHGSDGILGYAGLLAPAGGDDGDIQTIAVAPRARRRGLGRTLMELLIAEARDRGCKQIFLEVRADNPSAQDLYTDLGFTVIGSRPGYYQPDNVAAEIMQLTLESRAHD